MIQEAKVHSSVIPIELQEVKSIYTTNTDFSERCRYEDEVMV